MKKTTALLLGGFLPTLIPIVLVINLLCQNSDMLSRWLGFAYWALTAIVVLLAVWMVYHYYLKLVEILHEQELKLKRAEDEKELALSHNQSRIAIDQNEYQLRKEKAEKEDRIKTETLRSENLLKLVDKLFDRKERTETKEGKETKTVTVNFRKELLDEVKLVKKEWDKMMNIET